MSMRNHRLCDDCKDDLDWTGTLPHGVCNQCVELNAKPKKVKPVTVATLPYRDTFYIQGDYK